MDLGIGGLDEAEVIGSGGSAVVYRAYQGDLDRRVAVKVLKLTDESFVKRFQREARTLGKLSQHPGIVTIYDNGLTGDGKPYLILEFCESSLHDELRGGPFDVVRACEVVAEVSEAVAAAHDNGVVHRDIKPGNILVSPMGRYLVADFGISAVNDASIADTGTIGFTAGYVAPEILMENQAGTPADVYALGATLFHLVNGTPPYVDSDNPNLFAMAQRVLSDPIPELSRQEVDPRLVDIVKATMVKDPLERPSARELSEQLRELLPDLSIPAPPADLPTQETLPNDDKPFNLVLEQPSDDSPTGVVNQPALVTGHVDDNDDEARMRRALAIVGIGAAVVLGLVGLALAAPLGTSNDGSADTQGVGEVAAPASLDDENDESVSIGTPGASGASSRFESSSDPDGDDSDDPSTSSTTATTAVNAASVDIPDVTGFTVARAQTALARLGLAVNVTTRTSTSAEPDTVIETRPAAGRTVAEGSTVTVFVARDGGTQLVAVPDVVGETEAAATTQLAAADLAVRVTRVPRALAEGLVGTVVGTAPTAGSEVEAGSTVRIEVSSGPICPDQLGLPEAEATQNLRAAGLEVTTAIQPGGTADDGTVVFCNQTGATVALVIAGDVCDGVVGLSQEAAERRLSTTGLSVVVSSEASDEPIGEVTVCTTTATSVELTVSAGRDGPECPAGIAGIPAAAAEANILAAGFATVTQTLVNSDIVAEGNAVACNKISSTEAELQVSDGPEEVMVTVPNVAGLTGAEASAAIVAVNLVAGEVIAVASSLPPGEVIETDPAAGTEVAEETSINIFVSSDVAIVTVPSVIGLTSDDAENTLAGSDLGVLIQLVPDDTAAEETVTAQAPAAGTEVPAGTTVAITVVVPS